MNNSLSGFSFTDHLNFGELMLLFCRKRLENVCAELLLCSLSSLSRQVLVAFSLWFASSAFCLATIPSFLLLTHPHFSVCPSELFVNPPFVHSMAGQQKEMGSGGEKKAVPNARFGNLLLYQWLVLNVKDLIR